MKKLMNTVFAASLALTLAACGSSSAATEDTYAYLYDASKYEKPTVDTSKAEGKLKEILSKGTLVIATPRTIRRTNMLKKTAPSREAK